jgi:hypothetical protein
MTDGGWWAVVGWVARERVFRKCSWVRTLAVARQLVPSDFREGGEVNAAWKHHEGAGVLTGRCDWRSATGRLNG